MLDDYIVHEGAHETLTAQEKADQDAFLDVVLDSKPMIEAFKAINADGAMQSFGTRAAQKAELRRLWFEFYHSPAEFSSGFEHVFVGEGKYNPDRSHIPGEVKGYHSWVKFYLDEKNHRVNYGGFHVFAANLHVVTVRMEWTILNMDGVPFTKIVKPMGGFFVGRSPACEMALATYGFHERALGRFRNDMVRVTLDGHDYDLVLYQSKHRIRSFFPKLVNGPPIVGPAVRTPIANPGNSGRVQIDAVLAKPMPGQSELVWLRTNLTRVDLAGWKIGDRLDRKQTISDVVLTSEAPVAITITRATTQLADAGGFVTLEDDARVRVAFVQYRSAQQGERETF